MGTTRLRFTVISADLRGQQFDFDATTPITVGRTTDNMMALDHKSVSRRHARIDPNGTSFLVVDLNSHNGTRVGDELVTEHLLKPGDVIGFGEVRVLFAPADAAAETGGAGLPALPAAPSSSETLPAKPLSLEDVFKQGSPTEAIPTPKERRFQGALLYSAALVAVIVFGLLGIWRAGYRPPGPPTIDVQLRAGEVLPVNIGPRASPTGRYEPAYLTGVEQIAEPDDERVAYAKRTKFRAFVTVYGRSVGTTDIPLYGPPAGKLILRVLVRGVKQESETAAWMRPSERQKLATDLITRARLVTRRTGVVDEQTTNAIRDLELAAKLLEGNPQEGARIAEATMEARALREARDKRFDDLARQIDTYRTQGRFKECEEAMQELLRIFHDPESVEYHVVRSFHENLLDEMAEAEREAQERH